MKTYLGFGLLAALTLAVIMGGFSPALPHATVLASTQTSPTFGQPTISGIQGVGFEQDLRLDPTNASLVYTSVPGSLSSDTSWIWHSRDGGKTFKWVTASLPKMGKVNACAGGGDTELAVDTGGNLYFNDLTLANFSTARSEDQGATFPCSNAGVPDTAVDRQWYAVDGNPRTGNGTGTGAGHNIYLANDEIGPGAVTCPVSGVVNNVLAMYRSPTPAGGSTAGIQFGPAKKVSAPLSCDEGIMGNNEVSPVATTKDGAPEPIKHVYVIHDDATFSRILIGRCFPVPFTTIPPPGLRNTVCAGAAAGDNGRVDIAWYGTPPPANPDDPNCGTNNGGKGGPDATTNGIWSLYMVQTLNGHSASPTFTAPVLAGEHYVHKGTIQTVLGGQCGDRTLGDFLQLRIGSRGEAQISYADSNNADEPFAPHGMYVKQNGGTSVYASTAVHGDSILLNASSDPAGDGKRESAGITGLNDPNLDVLHSSFSEPAPANCHPAGTPCYRVKMTVNNLTLVPPAPDTVAVWL